MPTTFLTDHLGQYSGLVKEFGTALAADLASRYLFGGKLKKEVLVEAGTLLEEGKKAEGEAILQSHIAGIGRADEEVLLEDLLFIKRTKRVTKAQADSLAIYLAALTPDARKRFRDAHNEQHDLDARRLKLVALARCSTPALKRAYLDAAGVFDPDFSDELEHQAEQGLKWLDGVERRQNKATGRRAGRGQRARSFARRHPFWFGIILLVTIIVVVAAAWFYGKETAVVAAILIPAVYGLLGHGLRVPEVGL